MPTLFIGIDARGAKTGADEVDRATDKAGKGARRMAEAFDFAKAAIVKSLGLIKSTISGLYNSIDYLAKRGALLGTAFIALNVHTAETIDRLNDMAKALDVSVEKMSLLQYASGRAGTGIEEIVQALKAVSGRAQSALAGDKDAKSLFSLLGVDPSGKSSLSLIEGVATGLDKMTDRTQKLAIAQDLLGRSGFKVVELFKDNAQQFRELSGDAILYGAVVDKNLAGVAENLADAWGNFKAGIVSVKNEILRGSGPDITRFLNSIGESLARNRFTIGAFAGAFVNSLEEVGKILAEGGLGKSASGVASLFGDTVKSIFVNVTPASIRSAWELGRVIGAAIVDGFVTESKRSLALQLTETGQSFLFAVLPDTTRKQISGLAELAKEWKDLEKRQNEAWAKGETFLLGGVETARQRFEDAAQGNVSALSDRIEASAGILKDTWGSAALSMSKDMVAAYDRFLTFADEGTKRRLAEIQKQFRDIPINARLNEIFSLNEEQGKGAAAALAGIVGPGFTNPKDALKFLDDVLSGLRDIQRAKAQGGTLGDPTETPLVNQGPEFKHPFASDRTNESIAAVKELIRQKEQELSLLRLTDEERERSISLLQFEETTLGLNADAVAQLTKRYEDLIDGVIAESRRRDLAESISGPIGQGVEDAIVRLEGFRDIAVSIFDEIKRAAVRAFVTRPLTEGLTSGLQSAFGSLGLFGGGAGNSERQSVSDANRRLGG